MTRTQGWKWLEVEGGDSFLRTAQGAWTQHRAGGSPLQPHCASQPVPSNGWLRCHIGVLQQEEGSERSEQCQHPHAWPQHHLVPPSTAPAHTAPPAQPSGPPPSPSAVAAQNSQCSAGKQGLGWRWAAPRRPQQSRREPHAGRWGGRRAGAAGGPRGAAPWGGWGSAAAAGRGRAGLAPSCHGTASTQQLQQCHSQGVTTHPILPTFQLHPILCLIFLHHNTAVSCPSCISSRIPSLPHPILCLILLALHPKCPILPTRLPMAASPPPHSHLRGKAAHALCVQLQGEAPRELEGNRGWGAGGTGAPPPGPRGAAALPPSIPSQQ